MSQHHKINYIEIPVKAMASSKAFFRKAFGWDFVDYGDDYAAIKGAGIEGGLFVSEYVVDADKGSVLVVLYSDDLVKSQADIEGAGGKIKTPTFEFPGGHRFHFCDRNGNEYAIWSDK
ncbi:VOC family protein [Paraglaciecola aquimarina]|uniref:VOC family protein n=1 Tax=Paraglaciecola aquimarina TaxID=1235557 RepID=A0ABU3SXX7_9ALTE|nr:VOC family protein [Paraglaciecola aquimarina]MDU0354849.1 VOC family protein [Paraglaciecola aquimarina]